VLRGSLAHSDSISKPWQSALQVLAVEPTVIFPEGCAPQGGTLLGVL
jgi:hypothetical protein